MVYVVYYNNRQDVADASAHEDIEGAFAAILEAVRAHGRGIDVGLTRERVTDVEILVGDETVAA